MKPDESPLAGWRKNIDNLDKEILRILAERFEIVRRIGAFKKTRFLMPRDDQRWKEIMTMVRSTAESLRLSKDFVTKLYALIHEYALEIENDGN